MSVWTHLMGLLDYNNRDWDDVVLVLDMQTLRPIDKEDFKEHIKDDNEEITFFNPNIFVIGNDFHCNVQKMYDRPERAPWMYRWIYQSMFSPADLIVYFIKE